MSIDPNTLTHGDRTSVVSGSAKGSISWLLVGDWLVGFDALDTQKWLKPPCSRPFSKSAPRKLTIFSSLFLLKLDLWGFPNSQIYRTRIFGLGPGICHFLSQEHWPLRHMIFSRKLCSHFFSNLASNFIDSPQQGLWRAWSMKTAFIRPLRAPSWQRPRSTLGPVLCDPWLYLTFSFWNTLGNSSLFLSHWLLLHLLAYFPSPNLWLWDPFIFSVVPPSGDLTSVLWLEMLSVSLSVSPLPHAIGILYSPVQRRIVYSRSPGQGNLSTRVDRGARLATVLGITNSQTCLND